MSFVLEVKIRIKPDQVENFMPKLAENAKAARGEPGCKTFDVSVDQYWSKVGAREFLGISSQ